MLHIRLFSNKSHEKPKIVAFKYKMDIFVIQASQNHVCNPYNYFLNTKEKLNIMKKHLFSAVKVYMMKKIICDLDRLKSLIFAQII